MQTLEELFREHGIPFETQGRYARQGWIQFHCPFCSGGSDPNKPYCGFNIARRYVSCWRCGSHGVVKTLMELCGLSYREAKLFAADLDDDEPEIVKHTGKLTLPDGISPFLKAHKRYLRGRGFDPSEIAKLWKVEGIGLATRLQWRLFIPIERNGQTVSWTTRSLSDKGMRYISASLSEESYPHKSLLYGEDFAKNAIIIHEGPVDVWRTGPGAVATLGTGFSDGQIGKAIRYPVRVVCFDSEPAAQARAKKLADALEPFPGDTYNVVLDAKDAGSASDKEIRQLRKFLN